jgi:hypothetical protein
MSHKTDKIKRFAERLYRRTHSHTQLASNILAPRMLHNPSPSTPEPTVMIVGNLLVEWPENCNIRFI